MRELRAGFLEWRLEQRYEAMVRAHLDNYGELAAGIKSLPSQARGFAATQAAWRFLNNERVKLTTLVEPLRDAGRAESERLQSGFVLLVHDWSKVSYGHSNKKDLVKLTHQKDIGYELTTALLVSGDDGSPLSPMELELKTGSGFWSTRKGSRAASHLEQVLPTMEASKSWGLSREIVHVIDREADSVDHYRRWDESGHRYLIRGDDRRVEWQGESVLLSEIRDQLRTLQPLSTVGKIEYQGKQVELRVVETEVVLYLPAKKNVKGKRFEMAGRRLSLRCVFAELRDARGKVVTEWILLSNVPREWAATEHLVRCYYWRWKIESFFKLLKSHGQQLEQWQQESGIAIARRLLVAAMACVLVWQLQADRSVKAMKFKDVLVQLSGRQVKRKRPHTAPALLAGLGVLIPMLSLLEHYDLRQLKQLLANARPFYSG